MKHKIVPFVFGFVFGVTAIMSIEVPLKREIFDQAILQCKEGNFQIIKIKISGKIESIECQALPLH